MMGGAPETKQKTTTQQTSDQTINSIANEIANSIVNARTTDVAKTTGQVSTTGTTDQTGKVTTGFKTPGQIGAIEDLTAKFQPQVGPGSVFEGQRVAGLDPLQKGAVAGASNFLPGLSTPAQVTDPLATETQAATRGVLTGATGAKPLDPSQVTDFFGSTIAGPARTRFQEDVVPGISEGFAGPGFFSSARGHAVREASTDLERQLGIQERQLQFETLIRNQNIEEAKAGRTLAGIPAAIAAGQAPAQTAAQEVQLNLQQMGGLRDVFGFGEAAQTQEQNELFAEFQKFVEAEGLRGEALDIVMAVINQQIESTAQQATGAVTTGTTAETRLTEAERIAEETRRAEVERIVEEIRTGVTTGTSETKGTGVSFGDQFMGAAMGAAGSAIGKGLGKAAGVGASKLTGGLAGG